MYQERVVWTIMTEAGYKPDGYSSISPYLIVADARKTLEFLARVFGAKELRLFEDDEGGVVHAETRVDDTVIMIADATPDWPPRPTFVHVYVEDVDETYARALEFGAVSVQEPLKAEDEDKRGGVTDPGGTTWWIATRIG